MPYTPFISSYLAAGLDASKPTAATLAATIPAGSTAFYYATDTGKLYAVEGGGSAWVQLNGSATSIADDRIMANISGGSAVPVANTLSDIIDACIGNTQGSLLYRGASSWSALAPGTAGQVLTSGGAGANPSWAAGGGGGINSGTSFPGTPSTNDLFYRTDRALLYYYDGTRWLTVEVFIDTYDMKLSADVNIDAPLAYGGSYDLWSLGVDAAGIVASASPASNYLNYQLRKYDGTTDANIVDVSTSAWTGSNTWNLATYASGSLIAKTNKIIYFQLSSTVGTPGAHIMRAKHRYRLVG